MKEIIFKIFRNPKKLAEAFYYVALKRKVSPWLVLVLDFLGLIKKKYWLNLLPQGSRLSLRGGTIDKWILTEVALKNDYHLEKIEEEKPVIIDLGAHIGIFTIFAKSLNPQARILAYEPLKSNFLMLARNVRANRWNSEILVFQQSVGDKKGRRRLYLDRFQQAGSFFKIGARWRTVETISLEEIFNRQQISSCCFLKIDVEGAEFEILYQTPKEIFDRIKKISLEYHCFDKETKNNHTLKNFLRKMGFRVEEKKSWGLSYGYLYADKNKS